MKFLSNFEPSLLSYSSSSTISNIAFASAVYTNLILVNSSILFQISKSGNFIIYISAVNSIIQIEVFINNKNTQKRNIDINY